MYQGKNYSTDGGDTLVIGGKLKVEEGAEVEGLDAASFSQMENIADLAAAAELADVTAKVNAILGGLVSAGIMDAGE